MAAKTQAHKNAEKRVKDLEEAMRKLEATNATLVDEVTKARNETRRTSQTLIDHIKADNEAAFRTVEIFVYNNKLKQTSRQYFGVAEGNSLRFSLDAQGFVHCHGEGPTKAVPVS